MVGEQLLSELGHAQRRLLLGGLLRRPAQSVVRHDEGVQALQRVVLPLDRHLDSLGRGSDRLLEEGEEELVFPTEVLVEAVKRLTGPLDYFLDGEVLS